MLLSLRREREQGAIWDRASFTVPVTVSEERVQFHADQWVRTAGAAWEAQGFQVLRILRPQVDTHRWNWFATDWDRRRYVIWALLRRRPVLQHFDIPEASVGKMLNGGLKLAE